jgi:hypothetical protein
MQPAERIFTVMPSTNIRNGSASGVPEFRLHKTAQTLSEGIGRKKVSIGKGLPWIRSAYTPIALHTSALTKFEITDNKLTAAATCTCASLDLQGH